VFAWRGQGGQPLAKKFLKISLSALKPGKMAQNALFFADISEI
jgi:hypothetical protein